jgi:hypothetical protein
MYPNLNFTICAFTILFINNTIRKEQKSNAVLQLPYYTYYPGCFSNEKMSNATQKLLVQYTAMVLQLAK